MPETLAQLGEAGVLRLVQSFCSTDPLGDDAALLVWPEGQLVVTTDALVDEVHFSDATTPPHSVGGRAAAANLSDLAAMGATPVALVVSLGLPPSTPVAWLHHLYEGLVMCCQPWQVKIVGGDVCRAQQRFISITAFGRVELGQGILRSSAQPGDSLLVTGVHGSSRAGLELLLHPECPSINYSKAMDPRATDPRATDPRATDPKATDPKATDPKAMDPRAMDPRARDRLIQAHQYPQPRFDVVATLRKLQIPRVSGMDTSDGLADALLQVCRMSQVKAVVDPERIPIDPALQHHFPERSLEWALFGGEDFELLLSMPSAAAEQVISHIPTAVIIGHIEAGLDGGVELQGYGSLDAQKTFQHFYISDDEVSDPSD